MRNYYTSVTWKFIHWFVSTAFYARWYLVFVFLSFSFLFGLCQIAVCIGQFMDGPRAYAHARSKYAHAYFQILVTHTELEHQNREPIYERSIRYRIPANIRLLQRSQAHAHTDEHRLMRLRCCASFVRLLCVFPPTDFPLPTHSRSICTYMRKKRTQTHTQ